MGELVRRGLRVPLPHPYGQAALLRFLPPRALGDVEVVDGGRYARTLRMPGGPAALDLRFEGAEVELHVVTSSAADVDGVIARCHRLLDLDTNMAEVHRHLSTDPVLARSIRANPGLRVPGHVDGFEVAVRAIVGQQISVAGARTVLDRIAHEYGDTVDLGIAGLSLLFPSPETLMGVDPERLPMPRARGRAVVGMARAVVERTVVLDGSAPLDEAKRDLLAQPGVGPWTVGYVALRALGDRDVFLPTDLGVRQGLARLGITALSPEALARWAPWRSYALMHVWHALQAAP